MWAGQSGHESDTQPPHAGGGKTPRHGDPVYGQWGEVIVIDSRFALRRVRSGPSGASFLYSSPPDRPAVGSRCPSVPVR